MTPKDRCRSRNGSRRPQLWTRARIATALAYAYGRSLSKYRRSQWRRSTGSIFNPETVFFGQRDRLTVDVNNKFLLVFVNNLGLEEGSCSEPHVPTYIEGFLSQANQQNVLPYQSDRCLPVAPTDRERLHQPIQLERAASTLTFCGASQHFAKAQTPPRISEPLWLLGS